jgi:hypothetical protein
MARPRPQGGDGGRSRGSGGPPPRRSSTGKRDARPRYGDERTPRDGPDRDQSGRPSTRGRPGSARANPTSGRPGSTRGARGSGRGTRAGGSPDRPARGGDRPGTGAGRSDRPTGATRGRPGSSRAPRTGDRPGGAGSGRTSRTGDRPAGAGSGRGARAGERPAGGGRGGSGSGRAGGASRGGTDRTSRAAGSGSRRRDDDRTPRYGAERYDDREMRGPRSWGGLARRGAGRATSASDAWRAAGRDASDARPAEPGWQPEEWIDEGELRDEAAEAVGRSRQSASRPAPERRPAAEAPGAAGGDARGDDVRRAVPANRLARFEARLKDASDAFRRERYEDARRTLRPLAEQAPGASSVRELYGLTLYRLGRWAQAARELEAFRTQTGSTEQHPVLADSYRALGRYADVEELWEELRAASPSAELVAEGRIVAAGALADQGRLEDAIALLAAGTKPTKKARLHHLRMAYALADLYERAGDLPRARELFGLVATTDPDFVDVQARLRALR